MIRAAFVTPALYWGGAERWMLDLARYSRKQVEWVGCATVSEMNRDDTMVELFREMMPVYEHGPKAVAEICKHAQVIVAWGAYDLAALTRGFRGPIVFVGHGQGQFDCHAAAAAAAGATHFAAVAEASRPPIVAAGIPEEQIAVLHNGIDPERCRQTSSREEVRHSLGIRPDEFLVAYIGRMVPEKNPYGVAQAVHKLPAKFRAAFVGGGWNEYQEREAISELLGDRAVFVDRIENVGDYYRAADCFAQASPREGFSMGMLEAMHCRVPCALTNVGVLPELEREHGRHWESVTPDSTETPGEMAEAIQRIAAMRPAARRRRTERCAQIVTSRYLAEHMAQRWTAYLEALPDAETLQASRPTSVSVPGVPAMKAPFERAFVINLRRRPDRLKAFRERLAAAEWPDGWPEVEVYPAIDGDVVGTPEEFIHGSGAYGCRMSHLRLLQDCLMAGVKSVLVFEDDADLTPGVGRRIAEFCAEVPGDWEGIMPGGQHHESPDKVAGKTGVVRVKNAQRTHCYIAGGRYLQALQKRWGNSTQHIDWRMRDFHHRYRVYAPPKWLVGQAGGKSDVYKGPKPPEWWNPLEGNEPVIVLHAPRDVMESLRARGLHSGMTRDTNGIDVGLVAAYGCNTVAERRVKLAAWIRVLAGECLGGGWITTVWHPKATAKDFEGLTKGRVAEITADSVDEALAALPEEWRTGLAQSVSSRAAPVVLLDAPRDVLEALREQGFHPGHWRDEATGVDHGLRRIFGGSASGRDKELKKWCDELLAEADSDGQVLTVWHPGAVRMGTLSVDSLRLASGRRVIPIKADTVDEARRQWEAA